MPGCHHIRGHRLHFERWLEEPEVQAIIAAAPRQAGRILRPFCRMLGIRPPPALRLPRRKRASPSVASPTRGHTAAAGGRRFDKRSCLPGWRRPVLAKASGVWPGGVPWVRPRLIARAGAPAPPPGLLADWHRACGGRSDAPVDHADLGRFEKGLSAAARPSINNVPVCKRLAVCPAPCTDSGNHPAPADSRRAGA